MDNKSLLTGQLSEDEWNKLGLASSALSQTDIRVDDNPSITVAEMNAKCRRIDNLGLILIDYLQLMTSAGGGKQSDNRVQVVSEISRALKIMAKELGVPVICLSQLSRANESRSDERPMLSDRRHRAGRGRGNLPLPRRLLQRELRGEERGRMHRGKKPPRRDGHHQASVAAAVYYLR